MSEGRPHRPAADLGPRPSGRVPELAGLAAVALLMRLTGKDVVAAMGGAAVVGAADAALYRAKSVAGSRYQFADDAVNPSANWLPASLALA